MEECTYYSLYSYRFAAKVVKYILEFFVTNDGQILDFTLSSLDPLITEIQSWQGLIRIEQRLY